ncbi:MAG: hypothetical protein H6955_01830 [Chromatiaceae bacterium]|nr:hypothetical protein [Chromatiaceae bacterium]
MRLTKAVAAWGTPVFREVLKAEIEHLGIAELPLQQALCSGHRALDSDLQAMINAVDESDGVIVVRVGLFYSGMDGGSCCADDPSPIDPHPEYCELQFSIDPASGDAVASLLNG